MKDLWAGQMVLKCRETLAVKFILLSEDYHEAEDVYCSKG